MQAAFVGKSRRFTSGPPSEVRIRLASMNHAQALASFPVKIPTKMPVGFVLDSFEQCWPHFIQEGGRQRKVHADYVQATFLNADGHWLHIVQGFTGRFHEWSILKPQPQSDRGTQVINGREALWFTAHPNGDQVVNGERITNWKSGDFAYVGWQDGFHPAPQGGAGGSPRYYGLASEILSVAELTSIAESVAATEFITTP